MPGAPRVVAAIDFGTYASGYAYMVVDPRIDNPAAMQIVHNRNWPGNEDVSAAKTRTALLVNADGTIAAYGSQVYQEYRERRARGGPLGTILEDFKLALKAGRSGYQIAQNDRAIRGLHDAGMKVDDAVVAYLRWIYQMAIEDMKRSQIQASDVEWCLTVPAIWEPSERQRMRAAATRAGLPGDRLILAFEPEAAAIQIYLTQGTLAGGSGGVLDLYQAGSRFMVVDGGGGTVDISAHQVASDGGGLEEIGRAKGERLGSQYLNQGFIDLIGRHLGGNALAYNLEREDPAGFGDLRRNWETAKRHVRYDPQVPVEVPLGARIDRKLSEEMRESLAKHQNGVDDCIVAAPAEVKAIFDAVVEPTLTYIDQQLAEMASFTGQTMPKETILMAGGFAASPYLQRAVELRFGGRAHVIQALHPETAVLYGAVQFARNPHIARARRVQYTWGIGANETFDPAIHDLAHRKKIDNRICCRDAFRIFIKDGDQVPAGKPVTETFVPSSRSQRKIVLRLYSTKSLTPKYADEPGVIKAASLSISIANMMNLPREQRAVQVEMFFGGTELEVRATNSRSGESQKVTVSYSYKYDD